jgi:hypothetical protein
MNADGDEWEMIVQGIVVPVSWDTVGNPLSVAILTVDEGEYRIAPYGLGKRLFRCLREEVKAQLALDSEHDRAFDARVVSFTVVQRGDEAVSEESFRRRSETTRPGEASVRLKTRSHR